ncbi:uncharacterized protein LOC115890437 [Sitophilus oryzae]|uniref:Uncharacterized protein LOC115890437 n=1 Tax=Sitophilus oryzae TaxID=7048 RepID=A0A6J2YT83_SITOR|nr:uncharacterized protein LOC115890437 [Sitophilus oryzae]
MENSPLRKKPKMASSAEEVNNELRILNNIYLNTPNIIEQLHSIEFEAWKECLERVEFKLPETSNLEIPDVDKVIKKYETDLKELNGKVKNMCDHIQILNILKKKQKCKISQLVDGI